MLVAMSFIFGPLRQGTMGARIFVGVIVGVAFRISQDFIGPASLIFGYAPLLARVCRLPCVGWGVSGLYGGAPERAMPFKLFDAERVRNRPLLRISLRKQYEMCSRPGVVPVSLLRRHVAPKVTEAEG